MEHTPDQFQSEEYGGYSHYERLDCTVNTDTQTSSGRKATRGPGASRRPHAWAHGQALGPAAR
eukprot:3866879-Pyramimonas_sp.AAC.1